MSCDPQEPLSNERHEAFCVLMSDPVVSRSQTDAWIESAGVVGKPLPAKSSGARVTASRLAAQQKIAQRIAYLRRERQSLVSGTDEFEIGSVAVLMDECTFAMMRALDVATERGATPAQQAAIRRGIVTHAGRTKRLNVKVPPRVPSEPEFDAGAVLARLTECECDESNHH